MERFGAWDCHFVAIVSDVTTVRILLRLTLAMNFRTSLILVCSIVLLITVVDSQRGKGRGRKKLRDRNKRPVVIFNIHPKRKAYYDNPNGAQIMKASHFDYEFILGHGIVLICAAKGNPRPRITWFKEDVEINAHPFLQISEWHIGDDYVKSKLEITPSRQMDSGTYDCEANNMYAVDRRSFKVDFSSIS